MLGHHHHARLPLPCAHCQGTNRLRVSRPEGRGGHRSYDVPCNGVTRAQADAARRRAGRWLGWSAFAVASIAAGVAITPLATLLAAVLP